MSQSNQSSAPLIAMAVFIAICVAGAIYAAGQFARTAGQLTSAKEQLVRYTSLDERAVRQIRDSYIARCPIQRSLEFRNISNGNVVPRTVLHEERLACIEEAFALNGSEHDKTVLAEIDRENNSRRELFRTYFDGCTKGSSEPDIEYLCVAYAHGETILRLKKL